MIPVQLTIPYSPAQLLTIRQGLVSSGLLPTESLAQVAQESVARDVTFWDLNWLLVPWLTPAVQCTKDEMSYYRVTKQVTAFYHLLTQRLLASLPLTGAAASYTLVESAAAYQLTLHVGQQTQQVAFTTYPQYTCTLLAALNDLLQGQGLDRGYYEVHVGEELTYFLSLSAAQYQYLLTQRLVYFAHVQYPEIDAWRELHRDEPLPF